MPGTNTIDSQHTHPLRTLLVDELRDLLHAEGQLVAALPKLAQAAHHPKLKEAFQNHLLQTKVHVERLNTVFELLGEKAQPKPCKAMMGLVEEGAENIEDGKSRENKASDLGLIAASQRVEHYEISGYGMARTLARQIGEHEAAKLLSHTLGEEQAADSLLTAISKPLMQECSAADQGGGSESHKKPVRAVKEKA